jgi:multicomponent Na+:H+ antiporter subunit E
MTIVRIKANAMRLSMLAALWWLLTGGGPDTWIVGAPAVAGALAAGMAMRLPGAPTFSASALLPFLIYFALASVRGGLQVAARALRRDPDLRPVIMTVPLRLRGETERMLLVSVVSILPGTIATALQGTQLRLHVLDESLGSEADVRDAERHVARMFGGKLP